MNHHLFYLGFVVALVSMCSSINAQTDSYEAYDIGTIESELAGEIGTWISESQAEISIRRASTGRQALRIFGTTMHGKPFLKMTVPTSKLAAITPMSNAELTTLLRPCE